MWGGRESGDGACEGDLAFVEGRRGAFGAGGGDGDGVGVVWGRDGVGLEIVDEGGLCGDGDVDCVKEETGAPKEVMRFARGMNGRDERREKRGRTCTLLGAV